MGLPLGNVILSLLFLVVDGLQASTLLTECCLDIHLQEEGQEQS